MEKFHTYNAGQPKNQSDENVRTKVSEIPC